MHSASFITCFSVGALHSSEIHRVRSSALSLLARVGPRGDLPAYVAARVYASRLRRRQSFRKSKIIVATVSVAIERGIYKISGRGKSGKGLRFRQTVNCPGANFEALFPEMSSSSPLSLCRAFPVRLCPLLLGSICLSYLCEFTARICLQSYHAEIMFINCFVSLMYNTCIRFIRRSR